MFRVITARCGVDLEKIDFMIWENNAVVPENTTFLEGAADSYVGYGPLEPELKLLMDSGACATVKGLDALVIWWGKLYYNYDPPLAEEYLNHLQDEDYLEVIGLAVAAPCSDCGHSRYTTSCDCVTDNCPCDAIPF
jgi:hypothetical protein